MTASEVEDKVYEVINELGEESIRKIGNIEFQRPNDNWLMNNSNDPDDTVEKHTVVNRYFEGPIEKWIREKLGACYWMGINEHTPKKRIIDLGTGAGWMVYLCKRFGHEAYGTDIQRRPEYQEGYNFLGIEDNISGDLVYIKKKMTIKGKFDYITTFRSFIGQKPRAWDKDEWKFFFEDCFDHLNDGGYLYLSCNSGSKMDSRFKHLSLSDRSHWGDKELEAWFAPYLVQRDKTLSGMGYQVLYIPKADIPKLLGS